MADGGILSNMKTLIAFAMSSGLISCAPSVTAIVPLRLQFQEDLLCQAFRTDSLQLLEQFFNNWQRDRIPLSRDNRTHLSDVHRAVYEIFEDFSDRELASVPDRYTRSPFCMIQNEILFSLVDTSHFDDSMASKAVMDTIENFKPLPSSLRSRVVHVTPRYETLLQDFIKGTCPGSNKRAYDKPWPGWPRANFLEQKVHLSASLLGFRIHTLPWVSVQLDSTLTQALVKWSRGNIWGTDLFRVTNGRWEHVKSMGWAIE